MCMEKAKHSIHYKYLEDVSDYKLSNLVGLWNTLPDIIIKRVPNTKKEAVLRNLAICSALYITGGRASEVATIRLKDITFEEGWIYIRLNNRKNKKNPRKEIMARLDIEEVFLKWLVKYYKYRLNMSNDLDDPLFPMLKGDVCLSRQAVYNMTTKYIGINPHFFRKLRASHLLEYYELDVKALQQYLGWASVLSSEPYLRISKAGIKKKYLQNQEDIKKIEDEKQELEEQLRVIEEEKQKKKGKKK